MTYIRSGSPSGPVGGALSGTLPNPSLAANALGNAKWNAADPLQWSNLTSVPTDIASGASPSLHTLGPAAGQSAAGASMLVYRQTPPQWYSPPASYAGTAPTIVVNTGSITYFQPFSVERPMTIDQVNLNVTALTSPVGAVYMGLVQMTANGNYNNLTQSINSVPSAIGNKIYSLGVTQSIQPGLYAINLSMNLTSGSLTFSATYCVPSLGSTQFGNGLWYGLNTINSSTTLPSTSAVTQTGGGLNPSLSYHVTAMT